MMRTGTKVAPRSTGLHTERLLGTPSDTKKSSQLRAKQRAFSTPTHLVKIIFRGTLVIVGLMLLLLCQSYLAGNTYVLPRITACGTGLLYLGIVAIAITKARPVVAAWMLLGFYIALAVSILWLWSINAQIGILTLGFVIILASTVLGARYIIPVTVGVIIVLGGIQLANTVGLITPDITSLSKASTFTDVISYGIIFMIFALISWLSRRQMEQTLQRALAAEKALEQEKEKLASRLAEQTKHLREVQLEEMQQLYRFAELGQQSTAVLHELANHLTILTLDIDDLQQRNYQSDAITNAKESINYLDTMVAQVRRQLQENAEPEVFNAVAILEDTVHTLQSKAAKANTIIHLTKTGEKHDFAVMGDPLRLSQVATILITNAVDAYSAMDNRTNSEVIDVEVTVHASKILLSVTDYGVGISDFNRSQLFEPFRSTKEKGMGIGLFIAKKMIETHFKGKIWIDARHDATEFVIQLPKYKHKRPH